MKIAKKGLDRLEWKAETRLLYSDGRLYYIELRRFSPRDLGALILDLDRSSRHLFFEYRHLGFGPLWLYVTVRLSRSSIKLGWMQERWAWEKDDWRGGSGKWKRVEWED